ncbi:hypothetical protein [Alkalicoccus urumqiensis]|uniref:Uncharacterized protein n=1 Tax=Alkalicoccus urumqiensis TaxID=1548213 RepID=A0A2P6MFR5_ALKUR|nr:hypothetical protein [Alkalicoccus urumqiensis]PRO65103.1 hypothetical protein C6I21_11695 [Alkalicoccus urumqiensis]
MTGFISLLLDSPFFLFLILAAVFSFIQSRLRSEEPDPGGSRQPQESSSSPDQGEKDFDWRDLLFETEEEKDREQRNTSAPEIEPSRAQQELEERYEAVQRRKKEAEKQTAKRDTSPITRGDITRSDGVDLDFRSMKKDDIVKGFVWSEVLSKPKSRR